MVRISPETPGNLLEVISADLLDTLFYYGLCVGVSYSLNAELRPCAMTVYNLVSVT